MTRQAPDTMSCVDYYSVEINSSPAGTFKTQPNMTPLVIPCLFSTFGHIARMPDKTDAKKTLTAFPLENCKETTGTPTYYPAIPHINNLSLNEAIEVDQNRPLWRPMSMFGATQWCLPEVN